MQWSRDGIYLVNDVYCHPSYNRNPYNGCIKSMLVHCSPSPNIGFRIPVLTMTHISFNMTITHTVINRYC